MAGARSWVLGFVTNGQRALQMTNCWYTGPATRDCLQELGVFRKAGSSVRREGQAHSPGLELGDAPGCLKAPAAATEARSSLAMLRQLPRAGPGGLPPS